MHSRTREKLTVKNESLHNVTKGQSRRLLGEKREFREKIRIPRVHCNFTVGCITHAVTLIYRAT